MNRAAPAEAEADAASGGGRRRWLLAALISAMLIASIEATVVATVAPSIVHDLGEFDLFGWVFSSYLLAGAIVIPLYGGMADLYGRKRTILIGLGVFLVTSVLCGFAWNMESLIVFRLLQGAGAGALQTTIQTIVGDTFTPAERARLQVYFSSVWASGAMIGPLLGSVIVAEATWPWVFWMNVPIGLASAILMAVTLRERIAGRVGSIDYGGAALLAIGIGALVFAIIDFAKLAAPVLVELVAGGSLALAAFAVHETRIENPMLPLGLLRNRIIATSSVYALAIGAVSLGATAFLSLYIQTIMGHDALVAAAAVAAPTVGTPFGSFIGGRLMIRTSYRAVALLGMGPMMIGAMLLILLDPQRGPVWAITGAFLLGIGFGLSNNVFSIALMSAVGWERRGIATSTNQFARTAGQALGAALFGGILNAGLAAFIAGDGDAFARLADPIFRAALAPETFASIIAAAAAALHNVYLIIGMLVLVALGASLALPVGLSPVSVARENRGRPAQRDP